MNKPRSIIGRTDHVDIASRVAAYLNERFQMLGAIVEESGSPHDCLYLIICCGPHQQDHPRESSVVVEACRAYIAGQLEAKERGSHD